MGFRNESEFPRKSSFIAMNSSERKTTNCEARAWPYLACHARHAVTSPLFTSWYDVSHAVGFRVLGAKFN